MDAGIFGPFTAAEMNRIALAIAQKIADKVLLSLLPFCDRIEVAGSIRRGRQSVGDIDLVALPKAGELHALHERFCRNTSEGQADGEAVKIRTLHVPKVGDVQIDLYIAAPEKGGLFDTEPGNFGSVLLLRTGSPRHNIRIVQRAKDRGLTWDMSRGILNAAGKVIASESEEDIYRVLDLEFIPPQNREIPNF